MTNSIDQLINLVHLAGHALIKRFHERHRLLDSADIGVCQEKHQYELVLDEDFLSQEILVKGLSEIFPNHNIYSEELKHWQQCQEDKGKKFLIDPLDGTHNYYYGLPHWGISLALLDEQNRPEMGIIHLPLFDLTLFNSGTPGEQTTVLNNGKRFLASTSKRTELAKSLLAYDNQFYRLGDAAIERYRRLASAAFTTRITGSASYDSVMVALGKFDARIWNNVQAYDVAASLLLIPGAGGVAVNFKGQKSVGIFDGSIMVCGNQNVADKLLGLI